MSRKFPIKRSHSEWGQFLKGFEMNLIPIKEIQEQV